MAIKALAEEGRTVLLSCAAAEVIVNPVAAYVFKVPPKDSDAAELIFRQMKKVGIAQIGLLSSNTGFGKAGKEQVEKVAAAHGIQIAVNEVYDKAATDLTAEVTKLKAAKRPGRRQLVHRAGPGDRPQERAADRPHGSHLPEPRLREHPVRQGGGRGGGGRALPGGPPGGRRRPPGQ